jgi:hypothetical protein
MDKKTADIPTGLMTANKDANPYINVSVKRFMEGSLVQKIHGPLLLQEPRLVQRIF